MLIDGWCRDQLSWEDDREHLANWYTNTTAALGQVEELGPAALESMLRSSCGRSPRLIAGQDGVHFLTQGAACLQRLGFRPATAGKALVATRKDLAPRKHSTVLVILVDGVQQSKKETTKEGEIPSQE